MSTAWSLNAEQLIDNGPDAALTCIHRYCTGWAVLPAGAAFHAPVTGDYRCLFLLNNKNPMRTDHRAHTAAEAFFPVTFQSDHIFKVA